MWLSFGMNAQPVSFRLEIPTADLADLRERLRRTRWPDQTPGPSGLYGLDVDWLQALVGYWEAEFDWRGAEAQLNAFPQFKVRLDGIELHFLHVPGKGPNPAPLLLSHGWPGSIFEFLKIIPRLTDPASFGGDPADAFTVVAPSLPGFGLSFQPGQKRFSQEEMADLFFKLMRDVLGLQRFGVQGGDWGAFISARLAYTHPDNIVGVHLTLLSAIVAAAFPTANLSPAEQKYSEEVAEWTNEHRAYAMIQGTRPQTLAYGLTDSPAGLAAWISEKFRAWSDGDVGTAFTRDELLANITLYWLTGAIGSSFWPYYARAHGRPVIPAGQTVRVPAGYAEFPKEILRPPRSVAERVFTNLQRWTVMPRGGHFAALEQPEALARELAEFFRPLRA
jgi:pimeloyl-ACP methyl ester carboxylesterase